MNQIQGTGGSGVSVGGDLFGESIFIVSPSSDRPKFCEPQNSSSECGELHINRVCKLGFYYYYYYAAGRRVNSSSTLRRHGPPPPLRLSTFHSDIKLWFVGYIECCFTIYHFGRYGRNGTLLHCFSFGNIRCSSLISGYYYIVRWEV